MFQKIGWLSVKQIIVYFSTMAVFKIRMSDERAELARIFRIESRTMDKQEYNLFKMCLFTKQQTFGIPSSRRQNNKFIIDFQNEIKRLDVASMTVGATDRRVHISYHRSQLW